MIPPATWSRGGSQIAVLLVLGACTHAPAGRRVELYFGRMQATRAIDDAQFAAFERDEIRARLPAGYTLLAGRGHWTSPDGRVVDEPSTVLVVAFESAQALAARDADLEAIRRAYRARFAQELVLRIDAQVELVAPHASPEPQ